MRKRIGVMLVGLALSLPLLTAVAARTILRGANDAVAVPASIVRPDVKAGNVEPSTGIPCRRSAADKLEAAPQPKHGAGPNAGCNLRLVKRRPADPMIWV
ncbi:hypothetical protein [Nevskia sp.]|uniref:hypothetical protein n=1 Tax=Nevskia sp. TaxID=1929292 RepID=UPI0025F950C8|nr:hypothetical protein [Nevskia sp.]